MFFSSGNELRKNIGTSFSWTMIVIVTLLIIAGVTKA